MFKKILFIVLIGTISQTTVAENRWFKSEIERVYPESNGRFVIIFKKINRDCVNNEYEYHYVRVGQNGVTQEGADNVFSAALAAGASGKEVSVNFDDSTPKCYINRMQVFF